MLKHNRSFWVLILFSIAILSIQFKGSFGSESTKEAYVTLLYGDEFLLGVRVLGKSIRDTGSNKDMVVLVSDGVSDYSKKLLKVWEFSFLQPFYSWKLKDLFFKKKVSIFRYLI